MSDALDEMVRWVWHQRLADAMLALKQQKHALAREQSHHLVESIIESAEGEGFRDPLARQLDWWADLTNDAEDHDAFHAAAAVLEMDYGVGNVINNSYINRWISGLIAQGISRYGVYPGTGGTEEGT